MDWRQPTPALISYPNPDASLRHAGAYETDLKVFLNMFGHSAVDQRACEEDTSKAALQGRNRTPPPLTRYPIQIQGHAPFLQERTISAAAPSEGSQVSSDKARKPNCPFPVIQQLRCHRVVPGRRRLTPESPGTGLVARGTFGGRPVGLLVGLRA